MADPPRTARPGIGAALGAARRDAGAMLRNHGGGHAPVSNLELFFDLVYVFAITQISGFVRLHLDPLGLAEGALLFLAVWWVWIFTTWVTNWLDPERIPVRLLLVALMALSLLMAAALPRAFDRPAPGETNPALLFVLAYCGQQLGRTLAAGWIFREARPSGARNMVRIACWFALTLPLWLVGTSLPPAARAGCWALALLIEYAAPLVFFRVPGLGRSTPADWDISGSHMAERCSLVVLIALGEEVVVAGSSYAAAPSSHAMDGAFALAFFASALLWWLYFDIGAARGAQRISGSDQAGRIARNAYTYFHMPIVAGIVLGAVGDALLLAQPEGRAGHGMIAVFAAAQVFYLGGLALFKRFSSPFGNAPLSHLVGTVFSLSLAAWAWFWPPPALVAGCGGVLILLLTAIWEWVSFHGGWLELAEARGWGWASWARARTDARLAARQARS